MNIRTKSNASVWQFGAVLALLFLVIGCAPSSTFPGARLVAKGGKCANGDNAIYSSPSWTPDNRVLVARGCGGVVILESTTRNPQIIPESKEIACASLSPDGKKLVFTDVNDKGIFIMNVDGTGRTQLAREALSWDCPKWSPDGTRIAFRAIQDSVEALYVMASDGGKVTQLSFPPLVPSEANWSPLSKNLVFTDDPTKEIYIVSADGGAPIRVTHDQAKNSFATWSANGEWIVYYQSTAPSGIYAIHPDGTGKRLLQQSLFIEDPAFSPDGKSLAFILTRLQDPGIFRDVYTMEVDDWFK